MSYQPYDHQRLEELVLSTRTRNCLRDSQIEIVETVRLMTDEQLLRMMPNFGRKSLRELRAVIAALPNKEPITYSFNDLQNMQTGLRKALAKHRAGLEEPDEQPLDVASLAEVLIALMSRIQELWRSHLRLAHDTTRVAGSPELYF